MIFGNIYYIFNMFLTQKFILLNFKKSPLKKGAYEFKNFYSRVNFNFYEFLVILVPLLKFYWFKKLSYKLILI